MALCFSGCISGWGWLVPYNLQPSYHKFKKMCKLNELPNDEEKYNKILSYFDTSLDKMESDWVEFIKSEWKISDEVYFYKKGFFEYAATTKQKKINSRISAVATFYSNESKINRCNTNAMSIGFEWHSRMFYLDGNEGSGFYWSEGTLDCSKIGTVRNMTPKGENNDQQGNN